MADFPPRATRRRETLARTKRLCGDLVERTGVDGVGAAVFATAYSRDLVYATDSIAEQLDEMQFTAGEGPCLDAFRSRVPELHGDIFGEEMTSRWPVFSTLAATTGARSLYAYPLSISGAPFGVLELYGSAPRALAARERATCLLFAQSIAYAILAELDHVSVLSRHTNEGVFTRGNVNVAVGILAVRLGVSPDEAFVRLRALAFSQQRRITSLAKNIVDGEPLDADDR